MKKIFVGQSKLTIQLDLNQSLAGLDTAEIRYTTPSQKKGAWPATVINSATGLIGYDIQDETEISEAGEWLLWGFLEFSDGKKAPSAPVKITVYKEGQ